MTLSIHTKGHFPGQDPIKIVRSQSRGLPVWLVVKNPSANAGDLGLIPGLGRSPGGGHGNPLQYSCLENPYRQRSVADYIPWGCKESDMTEQLSTAWMLQEKPLLSDKSQIWGNGYVNGTS